MKTSLFEGINDQIEEMEPEFNWDEKRLDLPVIAEPDGKTRDTMLQK